MKQLATIQAVYRVTQRRLRHTRATLWMVLAVLLVTGGLPFFLGGDTESMMRLSLIYPPVLMFAILLTGNVWSAAALSAQDIHNGTFSAHITKPASLCMIWLGKWFGVLALNAILLTVGNIALWAAITAQNQAGPSATAAILDGHTAFHPDDADLREAVAARRLAQQLAGQPAPDITVLENQVKTEAFRIPPGATYSWDIPITANVSPTTRAAETDWALQFRFHLAALERTPIDGTWTIESDNPLQIPVTDLLDGQHQISLPSGLHSNPIRVTFSNHPDSSAAIFFDTREPIMLLHRSVPFTINLLRTALILFCFLGAAAALSLSLGTLFSLPVATFSALALVFALMLSHAFAAIPTTVHHHGSGAQSGTTVMQTGEWLLTTLHRATAGALQLMPLRQLANGRVVERQQLAQAAISLLVVFPGCLCLISCLHLKRREFP